MSEVHAGPYRIHVSATGDGPAVVLLHSGGMSSRQWRRLAERLAPRHRVLSPDFIGYGTSSAWPAEETFHFTLDLLAIEALLDGAAEPVHLVGHSYGGLIALLAALHRPAKVRSVAVFEPVAFGVLYSRGEEAVLTSSTGGEGGDEGELSLLDRRTGGQEPWLRAFVDFWNGEGAWEGLGEPTRAAFREVGWKLFGEVSSLLRDRTPHQAYATLSMPVLLLSGERSPEAERRVIALLGNAIPNATVITIPGAGHMGPLTHADRVNEEIARHVASVSDAQR